MCVLLLVVPLFLSSLPGLSQLIAALAFLTFTSSKKISILLFKLRILPAAPNGHYFTYPQRPSQSQQLDTEIHACEAETSFFRWQMLRCPFNTSSWEVSIPFRSFQLPKSWQGWNGDAVSEQEKISAAQGANEGKINPTLPPSLVVCLHLQLLWWMKTDGLDNFTGSLREASWQKQQSCSGQKRIVYYFLFPKSEYSFSSWLHGKKKKITSLLNTKSEKSHIYLLLASKTTSPV